jgi:hypothetical protein
MGAGCLLHCAPILILEIPGCPVLFTQQALVPMISMPFLLCSSWQVVEHEMEGMNEMVAQAVEQAMTDVHFDVKVEVSTRSLAQVEAKCAMQDGLYALCRYKSGERVALRAGGGGSSACQLAWRLASSQGRAVAGCLQANFNTLIVITGVIL